MEKSPKRKGVCVLPSVAVVMPSKVQLLQHYLDEFEHGGLLVDDGFVHRPGDEVCLDICCVKESIVFEVQAIARWRRYRGNSKSPPGIAMELELGPGEDLRSLLEKPLNKRARRVVVKQDAWLWAHHRRERVRICNISRTGACVHTSARLHAGEDVELRVSLDEAEVAVIARIKRVEDGSVGVAVQPSKAWSAYVDASIAQAIAKRGD